MQLTTNKYRQFSNSSILLRYFIYKFEQTIFIVCIFCRLPGASPGFGRGGAKNFFFRFGNLHVAKGHAAHGEAMRIARGVRGHALPRKFFKTVQFGAF